MKDKIVINCALPYANGPLHIGHIAGAYLSGDIFSRFNRLIGRDVLFICGSDEYGTPIALKAEKEGKSPQEIVDKYHEEEINTFKSLDINFDYFGRTTSEVHQSFVTSFFESLEDKGYLYRKNMVSAYCPKESKFLPDRYVIGTCPKCNYEYARGDQCEECGKTNDPQELVDPKCAICGSAAEFRNTMHIFFKTSELSKFLYEWLKTKKEWRSNVTSFPLNIIESGLNDRPITRDMDWGVKLNEEGMKNKRIYVWFDALLGYLSMAKEFSIKNGNEKLWLDYYASEETYYFMGKDNIFFHTIFLPAIHKASGEYPLPFRVTANEYLRFKGQKFSKSRGIGFTVDDILNIIDKDSLRYYISSILPETSDSDFLLEELKEKVNSELNGKYGNLVNRIVTFSKGKSVGPLKEEPDHDDIELMTQMEMFREDYTILMKNLEFRKALGLWLENVKVVNTYFNNAKPWDLIKTDSKMAGSKLWYSLKAVEYLTLCLYPFVPSGSSRAWESIHGYQMESPNMSHLAETCTFKLSESAIIFKKIEIEEEPENQLNLVVGKITFAESHPNADSLLHLKVDLGDHEIELVAGIRKYYQLDSLINKKIIVVENLKHAKIRGIESQGMLLAAQDSKGAHLLTTNEPEGSKVTIGDIPCSYEERIDLDILKNYELRVDSDSKNIYPSAVIGRSRYPLNINGKNILIDGEVEAKSQIR
jgi:methionyl-tRNA synthetase